MTMKAPLVTVTLIAVSLGVGIANNVGEPYAAAFIVGLGSVLVTLVLRGRR